MTKKYDAVIAGYLCVDMIPEFQKNGLETSLSALLKPGKLIEINGVAFSIGGVVANTGLAMKKFGVLIFLNGLIGNDIMGKIAGELLGKYQLPGGIQITERDGTAFGIVLAPPGVDRIFLESPGCSKIFDLGFIDFESVSQSRLFHFGYPPLLRQFYLKNGEQLVTLFSQIKKMGVVTSLDFSLPDTQSESGKQDWLLIIKRVMPYTDIFVPSLEEAMQIMMPDEYNKILSNIGNTDILDLIPINIVREIGKRLIDFGVKILLVKAGHRGIYLITGDISSLVSKGGLGLCVNEWNYRELWCNAYTTDPGKIKNASGAGDTAAAAFLTSILKGEKVEEAMKYAAIAGRNNLYCNDIFEELNNWQCMQNEMATEPIEITDFELIKLNML